MHTNKPQDTKFLNFRIPRALWVRLRHVLATLDVSAQDFCSAAVESKIAEVEKAEDEVSVRTKRSLGNG